MNVNDVFQQGNNYTIDNHKYKKGSRKEPKTIQTDNFFKTPLNSTSDLPTVQTAFNDRRLRPLLSDRKVLP